MYSFCPTCSTMFVIKAEQLLAANGRVRCGECGQTFRAFDYVYEDLTTAKVALADHHARKSSPHLIEEQAGPDGPGWSLDEAAAALWEPEISAPWPERSQFWRNTAYGTLIGALFLLLALQWLYFNRAQLSANNDWRPELERLCSVLHCELPLRVDLSRIELVNRDVRKHPQVAGALLINATLANHAAFPQPYPILALTFSSTSGRPVAARRFKPAEYLGERTDIEAGMPVDTPLHVVLEIEDPGEDAVSFQFEFL